METPYYEHAYRQAFAIAEVAAVSGPILAITVRALWWRFSFALQRLVRFAFVSGMIIGGFIAFSRWSLTSILANGVVLVVGYVAYCVFALWISTFWPKVLTGLVSLILSIPIVIFFISGITGLPLAMGLGELIPDRVVYLTPTVSYSLSYYGGATLPNNGAVVLVSTHPRFAPFIEHGFSKTSFQDNECDYERLTFAFHLNRLIIDCAAGGYRHNPAGKHIELVVP